MNVRLQHKKDTVANWERENPVILDGEIIIVVTDTGNRFKIGDGIKKYKELDFIDNGNDSIQITIPEGWQRGDVNHNGKLDWDDCNLISNHISGAIKLTGMQFTAADTMKTGAIASTNLNPIKNYLQSNGFTYNNNLIDDITGHWNADIANKKFYIDIEVKGLKGTDYVDIYVPDITPFKNCENIIIDCFDDKIRITVDHLPTVNTICYLSVSKFQNSRIITDLTAMQKFPNTKPHAVTIGSSIFGYTENDCDYLCDGTNDEEIINLAIQAASSLGYEIHLLSGDYNIMEAPIALNKQGITLSGEGRNTTLNVYKNAGYCIQLNQPNCIIKDLYILPGDATYSGTGIRVTGNGSNRTIIENIAFEVLENDIEISSNSVDCQMIIDNCYFNGVTGINATALSNTIISNNIFRDNLESIVLGSSAIKNLICNNILIGIDGTAIKDSGTNNTIINNKNT